MGLCYHALQSLAFLTALVSAEALGASPYSLTYGGRLVDGSGAPMAGPVELKIKFFDAVTGGSQLGPEVDDQNVALANGVFQAPVVLDGAGFQEVFGSGGQVFIEVNDSTHNQTYPRQVFTAVPYALRVPVDSATITYDVDGNLTLANPPPPVGTSAGDLVQVQSGGKLPALDGSQLTNISAGNVIGLGPLATLNGGGNLGIGTTAPQASLDVEGTLKFGGGSPGVGRVLTSDASGNATWQTIGGTSQWQTVGSNISFSAGNVGIGTTSPASILDVENLVIDAAPILSIGQLVNVSSVFGITDTSTAANGTGVGFIGSRFAAPVVSAATGSSGQVTETSVSALEIAGAPLAGNYTTIANSSALYIPAASVQYGIGGAVNTAYGLNVNAPSGATQNFAAVFNGGNVGIGSTAPTELLDVAGTLRMHDGTQGANKVLTSDANGNATWQTPVAAPVINNANDNLDNVAQLSIGTTATSGADLLFGAANRSISVASQAAAGGNLAIQAGASTIDGDNGGNLVLASGATRGGTSSSQIQLQTSNNGTTINALTILGNGNVGVGTTSPAATLDIKEAASGSTYLRFTGAAGGYRGDFNDTLGYGVLNLADGAQNTKLSLSTSGSSFFTGGNVGIGTNNPASLLDVGGGKFNVLSNGSVGIGTTSPKVSLDLSSMTDGILPPTVAAAANAACTASLSGAVRYNSTINSIEMCNGANWNALGMAGTGANAPNTFSFTDLTGQSLGVLVASEVETVTGFTGTLVVSVSGAGSPQISVNGSGFWANSGAIQSGQTIQVRQTTSSSVDTAYTATVTIGTAQANWQVTTRSGALQVFATTQAYNGNLGGLAGADVICQSAAGDAGYGGTYKAILSDSSTSAASRLMLSYPIVNAFDGSTVAPANLWIGSLSTGIETTTGGTTSNDVWTGTNPDGSIEGTDQCSNWSSSSSGVNGKPGDQGDTTNWWSTHGYVDACNAMNVLYCIQQ